MLTCWLSWPGWNYLQSRPRGILRHHRDYVVLAFPVVHILDLQHNLVLVLMPKAFVYDYDGVEGNLVRLRFRPNPNYNATSYEARVAHSLGGTILIDPQQKRLAKLSGQIINRVEFGYGILGHIDDGGTIEIGRVEVAPAEWKTALINIQLSGRLVFFKTINQQQHETRSDFRAVSGDLSPLEGSELLAP